VKGAGGRPVARQFKRKTDRRIFSGSLPRSKVMDCDLIFCGGIGGKPRLLANEMKPLGSLRS